MGTTQAFVNRHGVRMSADWADSNPNMDSMPQGSSHWKCVLRMAGRRLTVHYSMGPAYSREPEAAEVLDCLASDAGTYECAEDFESWAAEMGYDTDSRRAERVYRAVERQTKGLRRLMGPLYDVLLYETERL